VYWVFAEVKQMEHGAGQPPASNADLRMGRSYTSSSLPCLYKHIMGWHLGYPLYRRLCGLQGWFGENPMNVQPFFYSAAH
jgi:hypothetical protein